MTRGEKRNTGNAAAYSILLIVSLLICWSPIGDFHQNFGRQIFFHSPWRPKWSQLGALPTNRYERNFTEKRINQELSRRQDETQLDSASETTSSYFSEGNSVSFPERCSV